MIDMIMMMMTMITMNKNSNIIIINIVTDYNYTLSFHSGQHIITQTQESSIRKGSYSSYQSWQKA